MLETSLPQLGNQDYLSFFIFLLLFIGFMSAFIMTANFLIGKFFRKFSR